MIETAAIVLAVLVAEGCLIVLAWQSWQGRGRRGQIAQVQTPAEVPAAPDLGSGEGEAETPQLEVAILLTDAQGQVRHEIHTHTRGPMPTTFTYGQIVYQYYRHVDSATEYRARA